MFAKTLTKRIESHESAVAVREGETFVSYAQLLEKSRHVSDRLRAVLAPESAVALCGGRLCVECIVADIAILLAGMRSVPVHPASDVAAACKACGATLVFCDAENDFAHANVSTVILGDWSALSKLVKRAPPPSNITNWRTLMFSSGSSGMAHPTFLTDEELTRRFQSYHGKARSTRQFMFLPISYTTARLAYFDMLANGGEMVLFSGDFSRFLAELSDARPTSFTAPPYIWRMLSQMSHVAREALSACTSIASIGAKLDRNTFAWMQQTFPGIAVSDIYAASEVGLIAVNGEIASPHIKLLAVPELALDGVTAGALVVKGVETKDLVRISQDRTRIEVIGRMGDRVKLSNGLFVNTSDVEQAMLACFSSVVVTVADGELVAVVERPADGISPNYDKSFLDTLQPHERPSRIVIVDEIPRLCSSLKVDNRAIERLVSLKTSNAIESSWWESLSHQGANSLDLARIVANSGIVDLEAECAPRTLDIAPADLGSEGKDAVLLTGATGYLGFEILRQLLSAGKRVFALCRGNGRRLAIRHPLLTEITMLDDCPRDMIGIIIHCAAWVHFNAPYAALKDANVEFSWRMLEFAALQGCLFHFVSSTAASVPKKSGYAATKYVAERILLNSGYSSRLKIIRPGVIGPLGGPKDALVRLVKSMIELSSAPPFLTADHQVSVIPVQAVARMVIGGDEQSPCFGTHRVCLQTLVECVCQLYEKVEVADSWSDFVARIRKIPSCSLWPLHNLLDDPERLFFVETGSKDGTLVTKEQMRQEIQKIAEME